jgi:hypothetical protein
MQDKLNAVPRLPRRHAESGASTLERVCESLKGLRHGEVTVVVQDGIVVQIRRTDRVRLASGAQEYE